MVKQTGLDGGFPGFARSLALERGEASMLPVIEKEILHFEILSTLDETGLLKGLTFQGGTCLRLCYGSERASEDLDFCGGPDFDPKLLHGFKERLVNSISRIYGIESEVGDPKKTTHDQNEDTPGITPVHTWQIKVITAPKRPDIPKQRISLEIAAVPAHTSQVRALEVRYQGLPASYGDVLVFCETLEEVAADKLKAYVTAKNIRYRDIWDLRWLARQPGFNASGLKSLLARKLVDYQVEEVFEARAAQVLSRLPDVVESPEFLAQMKRFLPEPVMARTLMRPEYRRNVVDEVMGLYQEADARL
jgi:hypothetical protein